MRSPEEVLDVPRGASPTQVKKAYHQLARVYHPDRWLTADPQTRRECEEKMKQINAAYATLSGGERGTRAARAPARTADTDSRTQKPSDYPPRSPEQAHRCPRCDTTFDALERLCPSCYYPGAGGSRWLVEIVDEYIWPTTGWVSLTISITALASGLLMGIAGPSRLGIASVALATYGAIGITRRLMQHTDD